MYNCFKVFIAHLQIKSLKVLAVTIGKDKNPFAMNVTHAVAKRVIYASADIENPLSDT